jgi:hypothetical protein
MNFKTLYFLSFALFLFNCKNNTTDIADKKPFSDCKCGKPAPIFIKNIPDFVSGHNFTMTSDAGVELVTFKDRTKLQIVQTGCNDIKQEFSFIYENPSLQSYSDAMWIQKAIDEFKKIGAASPEYQPFSLWGNAIESRKDEFKIGEDKELEKGFFMKIDKITSASEITMIVTVYADDCPTIK